PTVVVVAPVRSARAAYAAASVTTSCGIAVTRLSVAMIETTSCACQPHGTSTTRPDKRHTCAVATRSSGAPTYPTYQLMQSARSADIVAPTGRGARLEPRQRIAPTAHRAISPTYVATIVVVRSG